MKWLVVTLWLLGAVSARGKLVQSEPSLVGLEYERAKIQRELACTWASWLKLKIESAIAEDQYRRQEAEIFSNQLVLRIAQQDTKELDTQQAMLTMQRMNELCQFSESMSQLVEQMNILNRKLRYYNNLIERQMMCNTKIPLFR
ncbi:MAG: hypothetical protein K0S38_987 [Candidatus Paceibacter sp.]|jgi:hypothetical protein|nr:hypothetical protein [Candidatus Paceibacter sp.]